MKKLSYTYLIAIVLMVFSYDSFSAGQETSAEVTYEIAEDDLLFGLLQGIFGQAANIIVGGDLPDEPDHIITALSEALNKSLTTLILFLVIIRFIRWVAASKSQGGTDIFDFQHAPLPILFAIIAIIPVKGGVSFLQMVTIQAAGYSIKISNYETNIAADFLENYGSYSSLSHIANVEENVIATVVGSVCKGILNKQDRYKNIVQTAVSDIYEHRIQGERQIKAYHKNGNPIFWRDTVQTVNYVNSTVYNRSGVYKDSQLAEDHNESNGLSASSGRIAKSYPVDVCGNSKLVFPEIKDEDNSILIREFRNSVDEAYKILNNKLAEVSADIVNEAYNASNGKYDYIRTERITKIREVVSEFKINYQNSLAELVRQYAPSHTSDSSAHNQSTAADVLRQKGTAYLGVFYLEFMKKNAQTLDATKLSFEHKMPNSPDWDHFYTTTSTKIPQGIARIIRELKANANVDLPAEETKSNRILREGHMNIEKLIAGESDNIWQYPTQLVVSATTGIMETLIDVNDPISGLVTTGHVILGTMESFYVASQVAKISVQVLARTAEAAKHVAGGAAKDIPFIGNASSGVVDALYVAPKYGFDFVDDALSLAQWLILPLLLAGIFLAFWLPSIPMIHWINTMVGFLIVAFNTFILVPALAISHLITTDNKLLGQKTNHGYMAIVQLLLYLPLVVISFFGSVMILMAGTKLIQVIYIPMMLSVIGNSISGLLTMFFFVFLFLGLNLQMFNRCFALLSSTPEKLNEYIGGGAEMLDDKEGVSGTKAVVTNIDSAVKDSVSTDRMHGDKGKQNARQPNGQPPGTPSKDKSEKAKAEAVNKSVTN
jgi:conjugal transfer/type IV secretion protein DotA/TraY